MRSSLLSTTLAALLVALAFAAPAAAAPTDPDPVFDGDGILVETSIEDEQGIYAGVVNLIGVHAGKIVTVGTTGGGQEWLIVRRNADGSLDTTFDGPSGTGNGIVELDLSSSYDAAYDVAITPVGRVVVVGRVRNTTTNKTEIGVVRLLAADGDYDTSFSTDGKITFGIDDAAAGQDAWAEAVALDGSDIVVGATAADGVGGGLDDFAIARLTSAGDLDTSFEGDGTGLKSMTGGAIDQLSDIWVDGSGNIVTAGTTSNPVNLFQRVFVTARWTSTGAPDDSFSPDAGNKTFATGASGFATSLAHNSGGDLVIAGTTADGADCLAVQLDANGTIDTGFSGDGYASIDFAGQNDNCNAVAVDGSDNVLLAGFSIDGTDRGAALARLTPAGVLDTGFDPDGKLVLQPTSGNDEFNTVGALPGGEILAGGYQGAMSYTAGLMMQFEGGSGGFTPPTRPSSIALDTTFDGDGRVTSAFADGGRGDVAAAIDVGPSGESAVAGWSDFLYSSSPLTYIPDGIVARYTPSGALDTGFDGDGFARFGISPTSAELFTDVELFGDGSVIAAGSVSTGAGRDILLAKFTPAGALDSSFDTDGYAVLNHNYDDLPTSLVLLSDGSLIVAGTSGTGSDLEMFTAKLSATGQLQTGYGTSGYAAIDFGASSPSATRDAVALPDDSVVIAGYEVTAGLRRGALAKLSTSGALDTTFDTDGKLSLQLGDGDSQFNGLAAQTDGKLVTAGQGYNGATAQDSFAARFTATGALDIDGAGAGFSSDGINFVGFSSEDDRANDVVVDSVDGLVTIGGSANYGLDDDFAFARFNRDGELLAAFDGDGFGSTTVGSESDRANSLALGGDGKVTATGSAYASGYADFGLTRLPATHETVSPPAGQPPVSQPTEDSGYPGSSRITSPRHNQTLRARTFRRFSGTAASTDPYGDPVVMVEVAVRRLDRKRCRWLINTNSKFRTSKPKNGRCTRLRWIDANGDAAWTLKLRRALPKGSYEIHSRATVVNYVGTESTFTTKVNRVRFKLR